MLATAGQFLKKYPFHFATILACMYPMVNVMLGNYDESLGIAPKGAPKEKSAK
jgi:hypothetical protein